jgi:alcohol dehydrogenase class IV
MRLAVADDRPLAELARMGGRKLATPPPPLIALPTISGYGAALSAYASAQIAADRRALLSSRHLIPSVAICDPTLTLEADENESASAGAEALDRLGPELVAVADQRAQAVAQGGGDRVTVRLEQNPANDVDLPVRLRNREPVSPSLQ